MDTTTRLGSGVVAPDSIDGPAVATSAPAEAAQPVHPRRRLLVGAAFAGPVALAAQYALTANGLPRDEAGPWLAGLAEDPTRQVLSVIAYLVAMLGGVAGAAMLALAGRRGAPWLSGVAAAMLVAGAVGGAGFAGLRLVAVELAEQGGPEAAEFWARVQTGSPFDVLSWLLIMAVLGTLVAAAAVFRARADIAVWSGPAMVAGFVLASGEFPVWVSVVGELVALAALVPVARAALRA
jgi:hypothetical protein